MAKSQTARFTATRDRNVVLGIAGRLRIFFVAFVAFSGCSNVKNPGIVLFAAASSNEAVNKVCREFESCNDATSQTSFAASSTLANSNSPR